MPVAGGIAFSEPRLHIERDVFQRGGAPSAAQLTLLARVAERDPLEHLQIPRDAAWMQHGMGDRVLAPDVVAVVFESQNVSGRESRMP